MEGGKNERADVFRHFCPCCEMGEQARNALFAAMRNEPANRVCIDCGANNPQWASVNLGVLFCLECAGSHRSLGVHISFVRSITMDTWSEKQLASVKAGGNANCKAFFRSQGVNEEEFRRLSVKERYESQTGALYREKLKATAEGRAFDLAKARAAIAAEFAAAPPPRHAQSMPQLPSSSAGRSSAALPTTPVASPSNVSAPPKKKGNDWDDDWDSFLNDKPSPQQQATPVADQSLHRAGSAPRMGGDRPAMQSSFGNGPQVKRDARPAEVFSPVALSDHQLNRDEEAEERLRRLGMADAPAQRGGGGGGRDWRDATPPEDASQSGGWGGGSDYYGALAQGWDSLAKTAVTYGSAAAKMAQDKLANIDTSAVKGYVQPIASTPVVASVSSYIGSWWAGDAPAQTPSPSSSSSSATASAGTGSPAPARKEENVDWSKWGWGAEAKDDEAPASPAAPASSATSEWGEWADDTAAKPRGRANGKRD